MQIRIFRFIQHNLVHFIHVLRSICAVVSQNPSLFLSKGMMCCLSISVTWCVIVLCYPLPLTVRLAMKNVIWFFQKYHSTVVLYQIAFYVLVSCSFCEGRNCESRNLVKFGIACFCNLANFKWCHFLLLGSSGFFIWVNVSFLLGDGRLELGFSKKVCSF